MVKTKTGPEQEERWWELCPVYGANLINHHCRLICSDPKCFYFQICSEFDL
jgi:hypothetical protein